MTVRSSNEIYRIIEELLKKAGDQPQTCVDIYEDKRVRAMFDSANGISDFLGHLWRRGKIQRWYTNSTTQRARYGYTWKEEEGNTDPVKIEPLHVVRNDVVKPKVTITEENNRIVLDFPQFTIIVQSKES